MQFTFCGFSLKTCSIKESTWSFLCVAPHPCVVRNSKYLLPTILLYIIEFHSVTDIDQQEYVIDVIKPSLD